MGQDAPRKPSRVTASLERFDRRWQDILQRREERRHATAQQSWPEFFRGLAIETGAILAGVVLLALIFWVIRLLWQ